MTGYMNRLSIAACVYILVVFLSNSSLFAHAYYVSIIRVTETPDPNHFNIVFKVFTDDLESAVPQSPDHTEQIYQYLTQNTELQFDSNASEVAFYDIRTDSEATWCFARARVPASWSQLEIRCAILTELIEDQKNVIQFEHSDQRKMFVLRMDEPTALIKHE